MASAQPLRLVLFGSLLVAACTSGGEQKPEAKPEPAAAAEETSKANQPVSEAEARAVFEAWLAAQTKRDFDGYAAVYAEDFEGIKRNGNATRQLEREAWLESRRKGFEQGFSITATGLELAPQKLKGAQTGAMVARFTQRWSTPSFADIGPKELVIGRRGEAALIVYEEMISSHVTRRKGKTNPPLMVLKVGDAHYAVLGAGDPGWVDDGKPAALLDGDTVYKPLIADRVSKSTREWIGRELDVMGEGGEVCKAKVASLEVVGRVEPSPELDDTLMEIWEEREPTDAELAPSMWSMISPELFVFGKLDGCAGDLAVPVDPSEFGRVGDFALAAAVEPALRERALAAFRALPSYAAEQSGWTDSFAEMREYGDVSGEAGPWDAREGGDVVTQQWSAGDERFVFHSVAVGEGCGDWPGSLWALWRVGEGEALELIGSGPETGSFFGDTALEPTRIVRWHDALWLRTDQELYEIQAKGEAQLVHATEPVFFGCPC